MGKIVDILVPKETVSDDSYKVTGRSYKDGQFVESGVVVASLESSKADFDVITPEPGFLFYNMNIQATARVGDVLCCVSDQPTIPAGYFNKEKETTLVVEKVSSSSVATRFSTPARKLMEANGITVDAFKGFSIVEKKDVENIIALRDKGQTKTKTVPEVPYIRSRGASNEIIIYGGGNHTKVCIDILRQTKQFGLAGIVYSKYSPGSSIMGVPVLGGPEMLQEIFENTARQIAIGVGGLSDPRERWKTYLMMKSIGFAVPNIIHPRAIIEPSAILGEGNHLMAGAVIGSLASIGTNCIINTNSTISHDCVLADNVHITPGAVLAGTVSVGENTVIGMGATVFYGAKIGKDVMITNGQAIFKDIEDGTIVK